MWLTLAAGLDPAIGLALSLDQSPLPAPGIALALSFAPALNPTLTSVVLALEGVKVLEEAVSVAAVAVAGKRLLWPPPSTLAQAMLLSPVKAAAPAPLSTLATRISQAGCLGPIVALALLLHAFLSPALTIGLAARTAPDLDSPLIRALSQITTSTPTPGRALTPRLAPPPLPVLQAPSLAQAW